MNLTLQYLKNIKFNQSIIKQTIAKQYNTKQNNNIRKFTTQNSAQYQQKPPNNNLFNIIFTTLVCGITYFQIKKKK